MYMLKTSGLPIKSASVGVVNKNSLSNPISKTSQCSVNLAVSGKKKTNLGEAKLKVYPAQTTSSSFFGTLSVRNPEGMSMDSVKALLDLKCWNNVFNQSAMDRFNPIPKTASTIMSSGLISGKFSASLNTVGHFLVRLLILS